MAESAIRDIVRYYTREAGVRALEREISKICRKVVKTLLLKPSERKVVVSSKNLDKYLGVRRFTARVLSDNVGAQKLISSIGEHLEYVNNGDGSREMVVELAA